MDVQLRERLMDAFIATFPYEPLDDLKPAIRVCERHGVAYQVDQSKPIRYGEEYFQRYVGYKGGAISTAVHASRVALCRKYGCRTLQDWGIGSGEFLEAWIGEGRTGQGYDINPVAIRWLNERALFSPYLTGCDGVCFWDSLEHVPNPSCLLRGLVKGQYAFVSLPVIQDLRDVRTWAHWRPNEHWHYFTPDGIVGFAELCGLKFLEANDAEHQAGRTADIRTFVFRK